MAHLLAPLAQQLTTVQDKLAFNTYQALFAPSPEERAHHANLAAGLNQLLENTLSEASQAAGLVSNFMSAPASGCRLRDAQQLVRLIEHGQPDPLVAVGTCTAMPGPPAYLGADNRA